MFNDFFGTEIKIGDLVTVTVTVNRNPTQILGRVVKTNSKTTKRFGGAEWTNHTISLNSISDPNSGTGWWAKHLRDGGYNEAGRLVKCGEPERCTVVNGFIPAESYAAVNEAHAQRMEELRKERARFASQERADAKAKEKLLAEKREIRKAAAKKIALAKLDGADLTKQEKRALGIK